jgi:hypothetical protein
MTRGHSSTPCWLTATSTPRGEPPPSMPGGMPWRSGGNVSPRRAREHRPRRRPRHARPSQYRRAAQLLRRARRTASAAGLTDELRSHVLALREQDRPTLIAHHRQRQAALMTLMSLGEAAAERTCAGSACRRRGPVGIQLDQASSRARTGERSPPDNTSSERRPSRWHPLRPAPPEVGRVENEGGLGRTGQDAQGALMRLHAMRRADLSEDLRTRGHRLIPTFIPTFR